MVLQVEYSWWIKKVSLQKNGISFIVQWLCYQVVSVTQPVTSMESQRSKALFPNPAPPLDCYLWGLIWDKSPLEPIWMKSGLGWTWTVYSRCWPMGWQHLINICTRGRMHLVSYQTNSVAQLAEHQHGKPGSKVWTLVGAAQFFPKDCYSRLFSKATVLLSQHEHICQRQQPIILHSSDQ